MWINLLVGYSEFITYSSNDSKKYPNYTTVYIFFQALHYRFKG